MPKVNVTFTETTTVLGHRKPRVGCFVDDYNPPKVEACLMACDISISSRTERDFVILKWMFTFACQEGKAILFRSRLTQKANFSLLFIFATFRAIL